jgi:hypothetical protein
VTSPGEDTSNAAMPQFPGLAHNEAGGSTARFPARKWKPPPESALVRMRRFTQFMPLIQAWCSPGPGRAALTMAERDMLAVVRLSVQRGASLLIRLPGGAHRLPLLAAAMLATDLLDVPQSELTRLSGADPPPGPVGLVTTRMVRRGELDQLDAASVPVAPALHPHRLRGDGLMSPVRGGRPRLVSGAARLLFVAPLTGFPVALGVTPRVVVIDAAAESECDWLNLARTWARMHGSMVVTIADLHQSVAPLPVSGEGHAEQASGAMPIGNHENRWIADWPWLCRTDTPLTTSAAPYQPDSWHRVMADARGRAHLLTIQDPALSGLAEVRERLGRLRDPGGRAAPWPVRQAARLTRLLTELPTRTDDYDRIAPRHGGRTLRRLLDDILDADPHSDFPASWRARAAADWGAVRAALTASYEGLRARNPVTEVIADLVEGAYQRRQQLDIVCGSRSAQEALAARLASFGTLRIEDSPLVTIRSISTIEPAGAYQTTLLVGPPAGRWRQRLTAADLGQLIVVGSSADFKQLYHAVRGAYGEPSREEARHARCATLSALTGAAADQQELDGHELHLAVTIEHATQRRPATGISLPDPSALLTAALAEAPSGPDPDLADLEAEPDDICDSLKSDALESSRRVLAVPVVIRSTALDDRSPPAAVLLAAASRVQRLRGDEIRLLPVTGIAAEMVLIGISEPERRTLFDRIRPLLAEQRPHAAGLLLQLWRVALDDALAACGSVGELADRLSVLGADITAGAVARWSNSARIGPLKPANVARIGRIAGSGVVAGEAARIAAVMREARTRHAAVGSALVMLAAWHASGDNAALDRAAENLGAEIIDLAADLTAWRVIAVGDQVLAPASALRRPMRVDEAYQISLAATDAGPLPRMPRDAEAAETEFLSGRPLLDEEEP